MRHINQIGIFWQVEIRAIGKTTFFLGLDKAGAAVSLDSVQAITIGDPAFGGSGSGLLFQGFREKADGAFPCVSRIVGAVTAFVVRVFEGMAGVVVDFEFDFLA